MLRWRQVLAVAGVALIAFGVFRLLTEIPFSGLLGLAEWLVIAVVLHDGVLAPLVVGVGVALSRVPARLRRYLQLALIAGALVTAIAVPLILRRNTQPAVKSILQRNYAGGLLVLLSLILGLAAVAYAVRVARDRFTPAREAPVASAPPAATGGTHSP